MIVKTPYNSIPEEGEINNQISETIPGQVQSIAEMLKRIENGQPINKNKLPFTGEDYTPFVKDLTDYDDIKETVNETFRKQKNAELQKQEAEKSKKDDVTE